MGDNAETGDTLPENGPQRLISDDGRTGDAGSAGERRQAWSRYWARGAAHSCVGTYGDTYGGAIAAFWREVFAGVPATTRVLDLATGNGALPRLLLEHCRRPGVQCDAVDIAEISPPWLDSLDPGERGRVRFHGGVDATALPFGERSFDLVVSQYGIEYTDIERSLPEMLRVLAPLGGVALVMHHAGGRPATLAAVETEHLRWLARDGGLFDAAAGLIGPMALAATPQGRARLQQDALAHAARERFNAAQGEVTARAAGGDGADALFDARDAVMAILALANREGETRATEAMETLRGEFHAAETRLVDLCGHALGEAEARALRDRIASALGVPVALGVMVEQAGHVMGWTLRSAPAA